MVSPSTQVPSVLSDEHARLLEWYFGTGRATFGRSTCGAIIERLQMFAFGVKPCGDCNGTGFRGGWAPGAHEGLGRDEELEMLAKLPASDDYDDPDVPCHRCSGSGIVAQRGRHHSREPLTARPKTQGHESSGYEPTDYALQHYAIACRRLDLVHAIDPRAAAVLEAFHGDWGFRWADTSQGRIFAVYSMTNAGKKLLRQSAEKKSCIELRPDEVLGVEFELQRTQPNRNRADMFEAARDQAKRLLEQASRVWNHAEPERVTEKRQAAVDKRKRQRDARILELVGLLAKCESESIRAEVSDIIERHIRRIEPPVAPAAANDVAVAS